MISSLDLINNPEAENNRFLSLRNRAVLIDWRTLKYNNDWCLVLAYTGGVQPFVTWYLDENGNCSCGHYFDTLPEAANDLISR